MVKRDLFCAGISCSLLGLFYSPLFFSFHLFGVIHNSDLAIVLSSVILNIRRLTTVLTFTLLVMYFFSITGLLIFEQNNAADGAAASSGGKKKGAVALMRFVSLLLLITIDGCCA